MVLFNFQKEPGLDRGHPIGGFTMHISSSGKIPLQKAFLQSPCFKRPPSQTAIDTSKRQAVALRTGAYLSSHDHDWRSKFLNAMIHDFARFGFPSISSLTVNKFIVGIARATSPYFLMYSQYC